MIPGLGTVEPCVPGLIPGTGPDSGWRSLTSCVPMARRYQQTHRLSGGQRRVMQDIIACRTAALGGQLAQCDHCGAQVIRYHSCQNRHCPKCQTLAKVRWVEARRQELFPVPYFHCVFTLPASPEPAGPGQSPRPLWPPVSDGRRDLADVWA